ncbi:MULTISPECIES: hypothetical protein [unclassified Moorena]|uniref:hypothetical protein n=1 Tax=unclassified Moorena TaxID=2683338 RepID=UPI0013FED998|nr:MULTISPECIES: hypothetical protein [unclassified Moorena]NEO13021.1 hypothetical protein [Moorena sp. SIO3E8]NEQ00236.1 hypothetical protein [Moorena sp. SIO3F7]
MDVRAEGIAMQCYSRLPTPDSRLPTPNSRLPTPDSLKSDFLLRNYHRPYLSIPHAPPDFTGILVSATCTKNCS